MNELKLIHYSSKKIKKLEKKTYDQEQMKFHPKPRGLWVSVEGNESDSNYNWKQWCESEKFYLEGLKHSHEVILKENSNIIYLKTDKEIFDFTKKYPKSTRYWDKEWDTYELDWVQIKKEYQGIIISPYQWPCRLALESGWYYGWDCSSGCIWDIEAIKEFNIRSNDGLDQH